MRPLTSVPALAIATLCAACTLDAGTGFGTLTEAMLDVRLSHPVLTTDLGYEVRIDRARLHVEDIGVLGGEAQTTGSDAFDPTDPPPGYDNCHGGHCHAGDGRLVSYEEIAAEIGGVVASPSSVVAVHVERDVDLLSDEVLSLDAFEPSAELPLGELSRVEVAVGALVVSGTVSGGPTPGGFGMRVIPLEIDVPEGGGIGASIRREIDRDSPPELALSVLLVLDGAALDGVELASLESAGAVRIVNDESDPDSPAEAVHEWLLASEPDVELR